MNRKILKDEMDRANVTNADIEREVGLSKGSLSKYFSYESGLTFPKYQKAIKFLNPIEHLNILEKIYPTLDKPSDIKNAMEFCSLNRNFESLEFLCNKGEEMSPPLKDWANVYRMYAIYQKGKYDPFELDFMANTYVARSEETKVLLIFLSAWLNMFKRNYPQMYNLALTSKRSIPNIGDNFIRSCYEFRLSEILGHTMLFSKGDPISSRKHCIDVIQTDLGASKFRSDAFHILGMSYLYEDYHLCITHINECVTLIRENGREDFANYLNSSLDFVRIHWGQELNKLVLNDLSEKAHFQAKYGNKELAIQYLNEAESEFTSPFKTYYRGLATENEMYFIEATVQFLNNGNKFYALLPYQACQSEEYKKIIKTMIQNVTVF